MDDMMQFPDTVKEFMERYKIVDTEQVYTNGAELIPIFRMEQWFDHIKGVLSAERHGRWIHRPVEEWGASNCKCSICGTEYFFPLLLKGGADNYCGNCGAKMVEK